MPSQTAAKTRLILTWVLRILLGVMFLGIGIEKLTGTMGTVPFFEAIGWGQWFRYTSGVFDAAGALLILIPRWTFYRSRNHYLHCGSGDLPLLHQSTFQSALSPDHDPPGRTARVARLKTKAA